MTLRIEDYAGRFRDSQVERELSRDLRALPEDERLAFINSLMACGRPHCFSVALWLAKTCLTARRSYEAVLRDGFEKGDASTIKYWLEAVIHGLGFRRVVQLLSERLPVDPESVVRARYWLRVWIPDNQSAADAFAALDQAVEQVISQHPQVLARAKPFLEPKTEE